MIISLLGITAALLLGLSVRRFWIALPLVIGVLLLTMAVQTSYASVRQNVVHRSGSTCWREEWAPLRRIDRSATKDAPQPVFRRGDSRDQENPLGDNEEPDAHAPL